MLNKHIGRLQAIKQKKYIYYVFVLVLLIFFTLNVSFALINFFLWGDEGFTIFMAKLNILDIFRYTAADVHPPMYYLLVKIWGILFGYNLISFRLFSLVICAAIFYFSVILLRRLNIKGAALIAASALCMPIIVEFSFIARMYSLAILMTIISTLVYLILIVKPNLSNKILYVLSITVGLYVHYFLIIIILTHLLHFLVFYKPKPTLKRIIIFFGPIYTATFLIFLPWLFYFASNMYASSRLNWIPNLTAEEMTSSLLYLFGYKVKYLALDVIVGFEILVGFLLLAITACKSPQIKRNYSALLLLGSPILIMLLVMVLSTLVFRFNLFYYRYLSTYAFLFYLGVGATISTLVLEKKAKQNIVISIFIITIFLSLLFTYSHNLKSYKRPSTKTFSQQLLNESSNNDAIVLQNTYIQVTQVGYYLENRRQVYMFNAIDENITNTYGGGLIIQHSSFPYVSDLTKIKNNKIWIVTDFFEYNFSTYYKNKYATLYNKKECGRISMDFNLAICYKN